MNAKQRDSETRWQFWIDRGGTFTDVVGRRPDGVIVTTKLLSENPEQYADAAIAGIRHLLDLDAQAELPTAAIESVKMGTTVATNALLERKGEPTVLVITRGFRDQLRIGNQARPKLFELNIRLPSVLYGAVIEAAERISAHGEVLVRLDRERLRRDLSEVYARGFRAVAIAFMHAWRDPEHERGAAEIARELGFEQVSSSHVVSPLLKLVPRGDTTVVDAYLSPILRRYVRQVEAALGHVPLYFMKSNGGLTLAQHFEGKDAILSGPAGGIVGMVRSSLAAGFDRCIGFDMGGTSTDVSHFAGSSLADCERELETLVAGVRMRTPMLSIHTVAAGGGSIVHFDGQRLRVGPDSAGANPGPACYRRGGPLTVTDCNVMLGRIQPEYFPRVFGPGADAAIDREIVAAKFEALAIEVSRASQAPAPIDAASVAAGCLQIAVANMVNAIKFISVQRGYDVTQYTLACFGGAGGQHACAIADELGMRRIYIHPLAGVLSAFGMGLADISVMHEAAFERPLGQDSRVELELMAQQLADTGRREVQQQGVAAESIEVVRRAHLKYAGTDTAVVVALAEEAAMRAEFSASYKRRFSFLMADRALIVEAVSVEVIGKTCDVAWVDPPAAAVSGKPVGVCRMFSDAEHRDAAVYLRADLALGQDVDGPAIIAEQNATTLIDLGWRARVTAKNHLLLERVSARSAAPALGTTADPVMLEVFNNLFMSIAEQMGVRLANTAYSVNIKERLDFSCALFAANGDLIANAPHMPVHLGSMSESIKTVIARNAGRMSPGDVYMLNDPYNGGTHLPDVTVVMPVYDEASVIFYVAARGHHADIGGITPGSMPPHSRNVEEEGVLIDNFKIVEHGRMREQEFRQLLGSARYPARNPDQNLADLRAQIAACEKGREELLGMLQQYGLATVNAYVEHVMNNAEESVRRAITALSDGEFACPLDNGAVIRVKISVDRTARSARVDFTGTSPQLESNFNAPPAVTHAAVLYVFRTLVSADIPMNAGCLRPLEVIIPRGSLLAPQLPAATVAGNVETSQCITDALYGALGVLAASQGTMNNLTFGDERYQYYETIAGGSGAGDGFDGTAAVQTHMTNSRMTDPEVIELRFPVRVEEHSIRSGSGGRGRYRGGDGALRRIRFLEPLTAAILSNRRKFPPYGMAGGAPGETGQSWVERSDGRRELLDYSDETRMQPGDVFVVSTPSGGGYGEPSAC